MESKNRQPYVLTGILALLVVVVGVLAYSNYRLNERLDSALGQSSSHVAHAGTTTVHVTPSVPEPVLSPPPAKQPEEDEDWEVITEPPGTANWDPFQEMEQMQREIDHVFGSAFGRFGQSPRFGGLFGDLSTAPRMNLVEEDDRFVVTYEMPGSDEADIDVAVDGRTLRVTASTDSESAPSSGQALRQERRMGRFERVITLPADVDPESVETVYEDGVLTVTVSKS